MLGAFGKIEMPSSSNMNPTLCAQKLAVYAISNLYDGIDVNWNDAYSFTQGKGESWLATFTAVFQTLAPGLIITHSPLASYFSATYPKGGYLAVHNQVGALVSFYNVRYFGNSAFNDYNTPNSLFNTSGGAYPGTSVN
jgi:hypothetical protein